MEMWKSCIENELVAISYHVTQSERLPSDHAYRVLQRIEIQLIALVKF
jgi:hypothetical protein